MPRRRKSFPTNALARILGDTALMTMLLLALFINLALVGFLIIRFEGLSDFLPLHFDAQGFADRIEPKTAIFSLPMIGFVVLFANAGLALLAHRRERAASLLLASSALTVQVLLWLAVFNIVGDSI